MPQIIDTYGYHETNRLYSYLTPGNAAEVARYQPKIYFNFANNIVVWGRTLRPTILGPGDDERVPPTLFTSFQSYFGADVLGRVENWGFAMECEHGRADIHISLSILELKVKCLNSYPKLKKLFICVGAKELDSTQEYELVDLRLPVDEEREEGLLAQEFIDRWETSYRPSPDGRLRKQVPGEDYFIGKDGKAHQMIWYKQRRNLVPERGVDGIRLLCKDGLRTRHPCYYSMRELLLKNGSDLERTLCCVWMREMNVGPRGALPKLVDELNSRVGPYPLDV